MVIELDHNALIGTCEYSTETEFLVLNLSTLVKISHIGVGLLLWSSAYCFEVEGMRANYILIIA